ncbi:MAG: fcs3 [Caulobacter sp.]|nr:fcs3 [Caulobacter sp.]
MTKIGYVSSMLAVTADHRDRPAVTFGGQVVSWGELLDRAARLAAGLRALGVRDGDRVAILSANSDLYMALYLAVPWAGGVLAPLNNRWSVEENAYAIADCEPTVLLASGELIAANAALFEGRHGGATLVALDETPREGWLNLSDLLAHVPIPDAGRGGEDLLALFYTGGTTGRSKGVMLSHAGFVSNSMAMRDIGICPDACRMLVVAPLFHLAAAAALTMVMLAAGTAVIAPAFDPAGTLDLIAEQDVTDALLVPTMVQMLLDGPGFDAGKLSNLKTVMYGASPMPEATIDRIMDAAPHLDFFQCYGMTEVSCTATVLKPEYHRGEHRAAGRHRGAGVPLPTAELMIVGEDGQALAQGEVGEILVRGKGVMLGYWNQPEMTAEALRNGWMHTGDGGRLDDHGILYVVDRIKDMIVSGGENVYSAEVESALTKHPDVAQCAVIGVPDERWGERVHAVVVARPGTQPSVQSITDHCRALIAGYKCPRSVEFRDALPLSAAGKVLKADLRAPFWQGHSRNVA